MEREEGFYWVYDFGKWIVCEWCGEGWYLTGSGCQYPDSDFEKIGPRIEKPEELDD